VWVQYWDSVWLTRFRHVHIYNRYMWYNWVCSCNLSPMQTVCGSDDELWSGVPLFGCFSHVTPETQRKECWPRFCPEALFFPCLLYGSNTTLLIDEPSLKYHICGAQPLGETGLLVTVFSAIASFFLCFPLSPLFCAMVSHQRLSIRRVYFPQDSLDIRQWECIIGCLCPPCALFQQFQFLKQKKQARIVSPNITGIPLQQRMTHNLST
jgi:hypothetical protein